MLLSFFQVIAIDGLEVQLKYLKKKANGMYHFTNEVSWEEVNLIKAILEPPEILRRGYLKFQCE